MLIAHLPWKHSKLRTLYPSPANGRTYLCEEGTGHTLGVVHSDGSGSWTNGRAINGPRGWRPNGPRVANVRIEKSAGQWLWIVTCRADRSRAHRKARK